MIQITTNIRENLTDLDNISNLLNYAVSSTINKHYSNQTAEEKEQTAKRIIVEFIHGKANVISNNPCPISYPEDKENGINGLRDLLKTINPNLIKYSILKANILSHAFSRDILHKISGYNVYEEIAKNITDITYAGVLDKNIDSLFKNENLLNGMVYNYFDMTFNNDIGFYNNIISAGYSDPQISRALEQLNLEQSLDRIKGNVR